MNFPSNTIKVPTPHFGLPANLPWQLYRMIMASKLELCFTRAMRQDVRSMRMSIMRLLMRRRRCYMGMSRGGWRG